MSVTKVPTSLTVSHVSESDWTCRLSVYTTCWKNELTLKNATSPGIDGWMRVEARMIDEVEDRNDSEVELTWDVQKGTATYLANG